MRTGALLTPRPVPGRLVPALAGGVVLALALAVFLVAGWNLAGWGLAVVLYVAVHALNALLARTRPSAGGVAASGLQVFGLFFKSIGMLVVLVAVAASNPRVAVAAAVTYALAYTCELGLSLVTYFGSPARR